MLSLLRSTLLVAQFVCIINYGLTAEDVRVPMYLIVPFGKLKLS